MGNHSPQAEPQILVTAVRELDDLSRRFRRRLRDVALELARGVGNSTPIGPDTIRAALPQVCREMLSELASHRGEARGLDGGEQRAA